MSTERGNLFFIKALGLTLAESYKPANARLIAAAPELLAVAGWALARLVSVSDLSDDNSEAMQLQRALRAAIAKAEGR